MACLGFTCNKGKNRDTGKYSGEMPGELIRIWRMCMMKVVCGSEPPESSLDLLMIRRIGGQATGGFASCANIAAHTIHGCRRVRGNHLRLRTQTRK